MKKISAILLSLILILCLSISASAVAYTDFDNVSIDMPSSYKLSDTQGSMHIFTGANDTDNLIIYRNYIIFLIYRIT